MVDTEWTVDRSVVLGSGGFGRVYGAKGVAGNSYAAKVVPKELGADRDFLSSSVPPSPHVVPILHIQENDDEFILFMPRAQASLREQLASGRKFSVVEQIDILKQIALGLVALEGHVVHRDLKPENILLLDGSWAICDFGISRYAESSTRADTRKFSMTPPYAAPEQWRHEHATEATDVYALGVIAHEIISGDLPFPGPSPDAFRKQHLEGSAPRLQSTKRMNALVQECLFKAPGSRPRAQNLVARLSSAEVEAERPGSSALAEAHQAVVESAAAQQRDLDMQRNEEERRTALAVSGKHLHQQIVDDLIEAIEDAAPAVLKETSTGGTTYLSLGSAQLKITDMHRSSSSVAGFDVIAFGSIELSCVTGQSRSHSLYYANFDSVDSYQWYELGFMSGHGANFDHEPRALSPHEGLGAFDRIYGGVQLGRPIVSLDMGDLDEFIDAWSQRFGLAAVNRFQQLYHLPEGNPLYPTRRNRR